MNTNLKYETDIFSSTFMKILLVVLLLFTGTNTSDYTVTFRYYVTNQTELSDGELFWANVDDPSLNLHGIFLMAVKLKTDIPSADSTTHSMVLTIPNDPAKIGEELFVERKIASLRCYFIARPDNVESLDPMIDAFTDAYLERILDEINIYQYVARKKPFYYLEYDMSIMAYIKGTTDWYKFIMGDNGTVLFFKQPDNSQEIFYLVLYNKSFNESNFFKIGIANTFSFGTGGEGTYAPATKSVTQIVKCEISNSESYKIYTPGNSAGIDMTKIETGGTDIEELIREKVLGLEAV